MPRPIRSLLAVLLALFACPVAVSAMPRHDACADVGSSFAFGVSSYSQAGDWPSTAHTASGVDWRYLYLYVVPTSDPPNAVQQFWAMKNSVARAMGAMPVFTFYELLSVGQRGGVTGADEASIVQQVLASPTLMAQYFDNFVMLLRTLATFQPPVYVQVEPDSWGFMLWSMGVDGNTDPTTIHVQVAGSGRAELAGFANDASGFARALLALRDTYAPEVRMGWHASNFRQGAHPDVVTAFYSHLGEWDAIFTEHPHNEASDAMWWLPWDAARLDTNVAWLAAVSSSTHLPILMWQAPIGTTDWHLLGDPTDRTALTRYANAGVAAVMFELVDTQSNVDDFRASGMFGSLSTVPPASSGADGTAGAMKTRVAAYGRAPLRWPAGSICARASSVDAGAALDGSVHDAGSATADATTPPSDARRGDATMPTGDLGRVSMSGGCGCSTMPSPRGPRAWLALSVLLAGVSVRGRRRVVRRAKAA